MPIKVYKFDLDIKDKTKTPRMTLVQGDANGNAFEVTLKNIDEPLINCYITFTFLKADGNPVVGNADIVDPQKGVVFYICKGNELSFPGIVFSSIEVYNQDGTSRFTTSQFKFNVIEQLDDGQAIPSTPEYTVLTELITDVQGIKLEEANRVIAEQTRESQEAKRQQDTTTAIVNAETATNNALLAANTATDKAGLANTAAINAQEKANLANEKALLADENAGLANAAADRIDVLENTITQNEQIRVTDENTRKSNEINRENAFNQAITDFNTNSTQAINTFDDTSQLKLSKFDTDSSTAISTFDVNGQQSIDDFVAETQRVEALYPERLTEVENNKADKLKVATIDKELSDYKATMAGLNPNQEAKQQATGYGIVSLPKNSANGQVSVTIGGVTETDEEGNTKSTVGAMRLKSVGKNLFDKNKPYNKGKLLLANGTLANDTNNTTDYIEVLPNTQYIRTASPVTNRYALYDKYKSFIAYGVSAGFTTTSDTAFVRFSFGQNEDINLLQLEKGGTSTPYEPYAESNTYVVAKDENGNIAELRSVPSETKDEISLSDGKATIRTREKILQASDIPSYAKSGQNIDIVYFNKPVDYIGYGNTSIPTSAISFPNFISGVYADDVSKLGTIFNSTSVALGLIVAKGTYIDTTDARNKLAGTTLTYQLKDPVEIPIQVSGNIVSHPSGTIYIEPATTAAGVYNAGISVTEQELGIKELEKVSKIDFTTGLETQLEVSKAVIAEDRLSFTHPDLIDGDIVFFEYIHVLEGTNGETTIQYYDSRYTIKDSVTGKFYKWKVAVANGVPSISLVEV